MPAQLLINSEPTLFITGYDRNGELAVITEPGKVDGVVSLKDWQALLKRALVKYLPANVGDQIEDLPLEDFPPEGAKSVIMRTHDRPVYSGLLREQILARLQEFRPGRFTL